jgi:hypothetical protein
MGSAVFCQAEGLVGTFRGANPNRRLARALLAIFFFLDDGDVTSLASVGTWGQTATMA